MKPKYNFDISLKYSPRQYYPGEWTGTQKGKGYEFWQLREYQQGDSISLIDWKARARTGKLYVKEFLKDTYYNLMLFCDISPSMYFGRKFNLLKDITTSLAYAALKDSNSCGVVLFSDKIMGYIKPSSIPKQYSLIYNELKKAPKSKSHHTSIRNALEYIKTSSEPSLNIIISDFLYDFSEIRDLLGSLSHGLSVINEFVAFHLLEDAEYQLPIKQQMELIFEDVESGKQMILDFGKWSEYNKVMQTCIEKNKMQLSKLGFDSLLLRIGKDNIQEKVNSFFLKRIRR